MIAETLSRIQPRRLTPAEFIRLPDDGFKYELVDGELKVSPAGLEHDEIGALVIEHLSPYVRPRRLGRVYASSAGYDLPVGRTRSPDVSFVAMDRLPGGRSPKGFGQFAPDLAVEILSPFEDPSEIEDKLDEYFASGARLVWLVDPETHTVTVYRSRTDAQVLTAGDELSGEDVVPGFVCRVEELFP
jgi:Uma2 family endonuclease